MNTRIAPSPTGAFHLGTARTAYFNYLAARSTGGRFVLRIDDTDASRNDASHTDSIYRAMDWLGLDYDDTFKQSDRLDAYIAKADALVRTGDAVCRDGAIFFVPRIRITSWRDSIVGNVDCSDDVSQAVDRMVLIKSDGFPSYQFASVVDDIDCGIDHVIRGADHIPNTIKQVYLYAALSAVLPTYSHVGLIHLNGKKMSKRDGAAGLNFYMDAGYSPAAVLNALLMLGWGHPDPNFDKSHPVVTKDMAVRLFRDGRMRNIASNLNMQKLDWYNKRTRKYAAAGI